MKKNSLQLNEPEISTYPYVTNVLSLIGINESIKKWIYSHFIQSSAFIATENDYTDIFLDFTPNDLSIFECPFIKVQLISRETIKRKYSSFYDFIVESIDMGHYVYGVLNQGRFFEDKDYEQFCHDTFIFGYDNQEGVIDLADFTFTSKYSTVQVPVHLVNKSFYDVPEIDDNVFMNNGGFVLFKRAENVSFDFDVNLVRKLLTAYLHPKSYYEIASWRVNHRMNAKGTPWHGVTPWYGIDVYDILIDRMHKIAKDEITFSDIRNMHVLYEHKKLMADRISFMSEKGYLNISKDTIGRFAILSNEARMVELILMKQQLKKKIAIGSLNKCIDTLHFIRDEEGHLYQLVLDNLKSL